MSLIPFIALRFLKTGSRRHFPFLTAVSIVGVSLSVFSFVVIHSVMNGFSSHIRGALIGFNAHVTITLPETESDPEKIGKWLEERREVASISLVSELSGIIEVSEGAMAGVKIRGVDLSQGLASPLLEPASSVALRASGNSAQFAPPVAGLPAYSSRRPWRLGSLQIYPFEERANVLEPEGARGGIVIGEELFYRLGLIPGAETTVRLLIPVGDVGPTGEVVPEVKEFAVTGVFSTGFYEQDSRYVLISRGEAERFSPLTPAKLQIFVHLREAEDSWPLVRDFEKRFAGIGVVPWQERDRRVLKALKLEKTAMLLLLSIVTAIASFGILGLTTLLALRRLKDMALLSALGLSHASLARLPLLTGSAIGLVGTVLGFVSGFGVIFYLSSNPPLLPPAYSVDFLPVKIDLVVLGAAFVLAPVLAVVASFWPATRLSKMATVELLRST